MAYSKKIYNKAIAQLKTRRNTAEQSLQSRKYNFALIEPEYKEIERELADTGAKTINIIINRKPNAMEEIENLKKRNLSLQEKLNSLIRKHNFSDDYLKPQYTCSVCSDTGYVDGWMCLCLKSLLKEISITELNSQTPLSLSSFENFDLGYYPDFEENGNISPRMIMENIYSNCKWYSENFSKKSDSILFQGATGLGKTHLSLAIANGVIDKGYSVLYGSTQEIMGKIEKEHFGKIVNNEQDTLQLAIDTDLLILDDLGTEFVTSFIVSTLYQIINSRILKGIPTIISTNLSLAELEKKYSERIVSRIAGTYKMMRFQGKDIRILKLRKN